MTAPGPAPVAPLPLDAAARARLEEWKAKLIDLSRRNRLLALRAGRAGVLRIVEEDPREIEGLLEAGRRLGLDPRPEGAAAPPEGVLRTGDTRLQTDLPPEALAKALQRLHRESRASVEEQGFHTLYLALGTLTYRTPDDARPWTAPLLLVPAELSRRGARAEPLLAAADEEPRVNPALLVKLRRELGVEVTLPEDPEAWTFDAVAEAFRRAATGREGWSVGGEVHLGLWSFAKIPLYEDLLEHGERIAGHPLVWSLASGRPPPGAAAPAVPAPTEVEAASDPAGAHLVLDADSSQGAALLAARAGLSFVLQGPPGTGKSQTIANLVAEALARGETVLFVSEKMAALEVVQRRLAGAGLGDLVLELHSRKASKREVVQGLARSWARWSEAAAPRRGDLAELETLRGQLAAYVRELHAPRGAAGLPAHRILGEAARLAHVPAVAFDLGDPLAADGPRLQAARRALRELAEVRAAVEPVASHPWRASRLARLGVSTLEEVRRALNLLARALEDATAAAAALDAALGTPAATTLEERARRRELAAHVAAAPRVAEAWTAASWTGTSPRARDLLAEGREFEGLRADLLARYDPAVLRADAPALLGRARPGGFLLGWWRRRAVRGELRALLRTPGRVADAAADLRAVARAQDLAAALGRGEADLRAAFGDAYAGPEGRFGPLEEAAAWVERFRALWPGGADASPEVRALLASGDRARLAAAREAAARTDAGLAARAADLASTARLDESLAHPEGLARAPVEALAARADAWAAALDALPAWAAWRARRDEAAAAGLAAYLDAFDALGLESRHLVSGWFRAWSRAASDRILAEVPALAAFDGTTHEARLERWRAMDREHVRRGGERVEAAHRTAVPVPGAAGAADSETGILRREIEKQTRHLPTRRLFERIPNLLRALKPCLMMSPLSVATYLPPGSRPFDLVVFDEASQICTEDGVGALARGRRAVVAGDSRQLPPTRFFERRVEAEGEPSEEVLEDLPSVLDECNAAGLPQVALRWHYRSRDESLIAFSNEHFYDGSLVTFPNAARDAGDLGISFVEVQGGTYLRGRGQTNPVEARAVAARVFEILRTRPHDSIGVVTFSVPQRDAVLDALEALRREDESFEPRFDAEEGEPVFVKNLEAVQGDERDVILFSVGYGPDEEGVFRMEFGPLNQDGGDRRLNVAVTRARKQVVVHASIRPEQIDPERAKSRGARLLRSYLEVARRGMAAPPPETAAAAEEAPPLAAAVAEELRERGYAVDADVGRSAFRIDLAVRHPDRPGRWVLGILTDGPSYARAATTRDRDRIRPEVLRGLGWTLHRVWTPDWVRFPERETQRIVEAVEKARRAPPPAAREPVPPPARPPAPEAAEGAPPAPPPAAALGFADYELTGLAPQGDPEAFPEAPLAKVVAALRRVVRAEGPVHEALAARRLAAAWGLARAGSRVQERVREAAARLVAEGEVERRGAFLHLRDAGPVTARRPAEGAARTVDLIPPEELADAVLRVARACYSAPRASLVREAARALGFSRTGGRVDAHLDAAIDALLAAGRLRTEGDRLAPA